MAERAVSHPFKANAKDSCKAQRYNISGPPGHKKDSNGVKGDVPPQHEYLAVGKVNQPEDPVNHGVANGYQGIQAPQGQGADQILQKLIDASHAMPLTPFSFLLLGINDY